MKVLFVHQAFPAQFKHLAPALAARGDQVLGLHNRPENPSDWRGVPLARYLVEREPRPNIHPWLINFEGQVLRAEAGFNRALELKREGFSPDVIVAHPSWGDSLFLNEVWPDARLGLYCELHHAAVQMDFDPEFTTVDPTEPLRRRLKGQIVDLNFRDAKAGLAPTHWQADSFPEPFRGRIEVIHDGIDTALAAPNGDIRISLDEGPALTRADEVITFVNRNLEPLRGYHVFMRALPEILARRPKARVVIIGGEGASYGPPPRDAASWKQKFIDEVRPAIPDQDWARVQFMGQLPHAHFIALMQLSSVHVYLTYPYVLSWSLLEAMSTGCAIVANDVGPVREAITHGETGRLVDFLDVAGLAAEVCDLLENPAERARLGAAARARAVAEYDLTAVCLPKQIAWVDRLAGL